MGRTAVASLLFCLRCRLHGMQVRLGVCHGRQPRLIGAGEVRAQLLKVRNHNARSELGAARGGLLDIGRGVFVNQGCSIVAHTVITLEDDVMIGDHVSIYDTGHHPVDADTPTATGPVTIRANAWIAARAVVLPGVTVGRNAVVAAGSVVTSDVPDDTLVAGNPARPVRTLRTAPGWRRADAR